MSTEDTPPPAQPPVVKPKEAIRYFEAKGFAFGFSWQDVFQEEHARAFTVAKAMSRDLLEDIRAALDAAITEGTTLREFSAQLRPKLEARGWWGRKKQFDPLTGKLETVQLGSPRRLKTIFQVNMRTAYQAGRWERIQRQKTLFPLLRYVSVMDGRERPEHHAWHDTVLPVDHPWWDSHYPPCGWNCRCTAIPMNERMLGRKGLEVTEEPQRFPERPWTNKRTGEVHAIEEGIDPGWSYNVGKAALDGLAPPPLGQGGDEAAISSVSAAAFDRLRGFFGGFGIETAEAARRGKVWTDPAGWPTLISCGMLRDPGGAPAGIDLLQLEHAARTMTGATEVRLRWITGKDGRRFSCAATSALAMTAARWMSADRAGAGSPAIRRGFARDWLFGERRTDHCIGS